MKIFVYKVVFLMFCLFLLFNFTIGYQVRKIEDKILNISSKNKIEEFKVKLKKEIKSGLKKENIFQDDERELIRDFLQKIILELVNISNPNDFEKTIFIFPEGVLPFVYLEDLKNYSYIFEENYSEQHKIIMGINRIKVVR